MVTKLTVAILGSGLVNFSLAVKELKGGKYSTVVDSNGGNLRQSRQQKTDRISLSRKAFIRGEEAHTARHRERRSQSRRGLRKAFIQGWEF